MPKAAERDESTHEQVRSEENVNLSQLMWEIAFACFAYFM